MARRCSHMEGARRSRSRERAVTDPITLRSLRLDKDLLSSPKMGREKRALTEDGKEKTVKFEDSSSAGSRSPVPTAVAISPSPVANAPNPLFGSLSRGPD